MVGGVGRTGEAVLWAVRAGPGRGRRALTAGGRLRSKGVPASRTGGAGCLSSASAGVCVYVCARAGVCVTQPHLICSVWIQLRPQELLPTVMMGLLSPAAPVSSWTQAHLCSRYNRQDKQRDRFLGSYPARGSAHRITS